MNQFLFSIVYAAILATSAIAKTIGPSAVVQFHSAQNPDAHLCLGAVADSHQAEIVLQPCSSDLTTFKLSNGAPLPSTLVGLVDGPTGPGQPQPRLCITATEGRAGNVPVVVQTCDESNQLGGWRINNGEGTGEIESTAPIMAAVCLTAVGKYQGAPVEFQECRGAASQQWNTVVLRRKPLVYREEIDGRSA